MNGSKDKNLDGQSIGHDVLHFSKRRIIKDLIVLCGVFLITFTAYDCLGMLQGTLNHDEGLGVVCQALVYAFSCITSLIIPKYCIKRIGNKMTLLISMCCYIPYILSNIYPHWSLMVPTSILNGMAASLLWGSQGPYLNEIAARYASLLSKRKDLKSKCINRNTKDEKETNLQLKVWMVNSTECDSQQAGSQKAEKETPREFQSSVPSDLKRVAADASSDDSSRKLVESTTAKFFGIYGMAYLSTHMWSNLLSYVVLQKDAEDKGSDFNASCVCGANYCNEDSDCFRHNLLQPSDWSRVFLTALCVSLVVVSCVLLALFLDDLGDKEANVKFSFDLVMATSRQMKRRAQVLLVPATFYIGMMQGFYNGVFTVSYVGCAWGTYHVGLVSMCYGGLCAVFSFLSGWPVKLLRRWWPVFALAFAMQLAAQVLLLVWRPSAETPAPFFVVAGLWGASLGILWSQVKAMYGVLFKSDEEAAFSAFHFWYSLGFCLSLAYSNHFCTSVKIYILMAVAILGMIGLIWVEVETNLSYLKKSKK